MKFIDLRSDTVTTPTPKMREAMFSAEVGDDVYGDDPTVRELEELAAQRIGKEAALFVPSGTMGNQLALMTHTQRGDEVILGEDCHIFKYEVGAPAVLSGVQLRGLKTNGGMMDLEEVKAAIRPNDIHMPRTSLICLENAYSSGEVVPLHYLEKIREIAESHGLKIHLDGARIFNAAIYLGVDAREIARYADSVMFCLSKGLSAPVGSILAGSREFVEKARKYRKLLGGGMRQAGILAAAGMVALKEMVDRLCEDHENALYLAQKLINLGFEVDLKKVQINMVWARAKSHLNIEDLPEKLLAEGIKINPPINGLFRFVTHKDVTKGDIDKFVEILAKTMQVGEQV
ncbi:low-specificity L-threonine aldolase [Carboxydothermus hydrogenoformans]|uniref:Low-specificity L-threonine aldolase n=1 Tax=Carboxydothermus hydrogenoformans (strain ATCC BAA-161 / DSM 6008 / Z-2901) TaxID=246194 RepID=Q3ADN1_CARHZ|nr:low-specificity L-threonine aldolase [Carboxydothermus hydrogenoformans]ABB14927.1 low-specificity L-threonine aldolase [Carboxydothermus hydrogenoformans Z-2901]